MIRYIAKLARGKGYYLCANSGGDNAGHAQTRIIELMDAAYEFCVVPRLPAEAIIYTLELVPFLDIPKISTINDDFSWLYGVFEHITLTDELHLECLLRVLSRALSSTEGAPKPPVAFLQTLVRVLALPCLPQFERYSDVRSLISKVVCRQYLWFLNDELGPILQQHWVWAKLAQFSDAQPYIALGERLSKKPEWKELMWQDLPVWLAQVWRLGRLPDDSDYFHMFRDTLQRVWDTNSDEAKHLGGDQTTLAMIFMALENVWHHLALGNFSWDRHWDCLPLVLLLESTASAVFYPLSIACTFHPPSRHLKDTVLVRLAAALIRAGIQVSQEAENNLELGKNSGNEVGQLITKVGLFLNQELRNLKQADVVTQENSWEVLTIEDSLMAEITSMRMTFEEEATSEEDSI
ncbi:hypothetical protein C8F04DRAFT_1273246 [Mycena alexandri]|uniref:Uncharacterized protein n=1 Tax=Mycena alexandri TaxID=1745969 RepID=A0AAD6S8N2_9AGAR|nr:hypothetical protein C8F04DRAFT_1273246 [Mycena alexandri]